MTDALLVAWTADPAIIAVLLVWGFGEAVVLPVVPDVLLGLLALATPAALGLPVAAAIAGGVLGAIVLAQVRRRRHPLVDRILVLQPGLGPRGMADAHRRIMERGAARGFAQLGPGLPLKAYVVALVDGRPSLEPGRLSGLALLNRVTRIVPVVTAFALVGHLARIAGASPSAALPAYLAGWTVFYLGFWWSRRDLVERPTASSAGADFAALTPSRTTSTIRVRSELQARGTDPRPAWSSFLYHQTDEGRLPAPAHLKRGVYPR